MRRGATLLPVALAAASAGAFQTVLADLRITTTSLPDGRVGVPYSVELSLRGGRPLYHWSVSGNFPPGLSIEPITGVIYGAPTTPGAFDFTVSVTDSTSRSDSQGLRITIRPSPLSNPLVISTSSLPAGAVGAPYSASLGASGGTPPYTWSATGLPPGLALSSNQIGGTPTQAGSFPVSVQVTDSAATAIAGTLSITVSAGFTITTASLPGAITGSPYSADLSASGGAPPYSWAVTNGSLPAGLALSPGGQIAGTPSAPGQSSFTIQAGDSSGAIATRDFTIAVSSALAVSTGGLPDGKVGAAYSAALAASGGTPPYAWSVASGSLPAGLSISGSQITGTPTSSGTASFTVRVTDASGASTVKALSILIARSAPPLAITTNSLADGRAGSAYSQTLAATGGAPPYTWSVVAGSLPAGLELLPGRIAGTPASGGTTQFTMQVQDSAGDTARALLSITVTAPLAAANPAELPAGSANEAYRYALLATGGKPPYSWTITSGSLPPGLTLSGDAISGRPSQEGRYGFSVRVDDSGGGSADASYSITIAAGLSITSTSPLPAAAVGTAYSQALAALAGKPPYRWGIALGLLPRGLSLDPATGVLSGTPAQGGTFSFTVQVSDGAGTVITKQFTMTVASALTISTESPLASGSVGSPYTQTVGAIAGTSPYTWAVLSGTLPPGLTLNASTGAIAGTPTAPGTFGFTVQVRDTLSATASKALAITIAPALAIATASPLPSGTAGHPYSQQLRAQGGVAPYTWSLAAGSLPAGLALDGGAGSLGGTPEAAGDFEFTLRITDAAGGTASAVAKLHIGLDPVPAIAVTGLPATSGPLAQPKLGVSIASPYPISLSGQLVLTFSPDATVPGDDPAIQFSTGGRTVDFTIPANSTEASLPAPQIALQTGSVAGTITVTAVLKAGGVDATPSPAPTHSLRIARSAPVIRSVRMVNTATGFEIWITGYSPSRDLTRATFRFTPASGADLRTTTADLPLTDSARQWYEDPASRLFGSQFTIVQPFTLQGSASAIGSISVTLTNSAGVSQEAPVQ